MLQFNYHDAWIKDVGTNRFLLYSSVFLKRYLLRRIRMVYRYSLEA